VIRALIVEGKVHVRESLKRMLSETTDISVAGEVADGREAAEKALAGDFDIVVLNISPPEGEGMEALRDIKHARPGLPVLVLSTHPEERYASRALKAGASGYVSKEIAPGQMTAAIRAVASGRRYLEGSLAEMLAQEESGPPEAALSHGRLSNREYQVFLMMADGKSVGEIAYELSLSPKTVSTYKARIKAKMNFQNNAAIIRYALEHRLVS